MPEEFDRRRILVVDDEERMVRFIRMNLEHDGFQVAEAFNGKQAIQKLRDVTPDLILLDVMMPDLDGFEVLETIREGSNVPVIMLTAKGEEDDRVRGLELGADDYITKPFSLKELAARVRAVMRRRASAAGRPNAALYRGQHLSADFDAVSVSVAGETIRLTRREFELLRCLVENRNRVLSRERLLERVWGYEQYIETRSVDVHVGRLRAKLGRAGAQIETVVGLGYKFVE
jgi:DNA-binding response OmpR family regulator